MKKLKPLLAAALKSAKFKKYTPFLAVFTFGVLTGAVITNSVSNKPGSVAKSESGVKSVTQEESKIDAQRQQKSIEQTEEAYNRAKKQVKTDLQEKTLTTKQAKTIQSKQDEIYKYSKSVYSGDNSKSELREKKREWRKWARDNNYSMKYFVGLL
jgi:IS5 family transposase